MYVNELIARSKGWTQSVLKVAKFSAQNSGAQLDIQQGEGGKEKIVRKMCIILNHEKTTLPI